MSDVSEKRAGRVVCTVGMHRSGTSVVSRMLNLLGVHLGPEASVAATGPDNPRGYWEHRSIVDINEELLARFGGRWDQVPGFPAGWARDPGLADLRERARALVERDFAAEPVWGWKDPRGCLTLPFWQHVIGPMRYVLCVRDPRAVVASLVHRNAIAPRQAERLWLAHVRAALAHSSGQPRTLVFYEDVIDDPARELRRLAAFLGVPERAEEPCVQAAVARFVDAELCHHRAALDDLAADPGIAFATASLYLALRGHAGNGLALAGVHRGSAWRLALFSRRLSVRVLPPGTRRRRLFDSTLGRLTRRLPAAGAPASHAGRPAA